MPLIKLPRFTFINGPAGSGKSTLATLLCSQDKALYRESFANPIRDAIMATFFPDEGPINFNFDLRDQAVKAREFPYQHPEEEEPLTYRDVMIDFSESWMKPVFGNSIFGRLAFARCVEQEMWYDRFVFDDCGFTEEVDYIVKLAGTHECLLIHLEREGCTFKGDSRGYIHIPSIKTLTIRNEGTPENLLQELLAACGAVG